jgi:hypothetical protein
LQVQVVRPQLLRAVNSKCSSNISSSSHWRSPLLLLLLLLLQHQSQRWG